MSVGAILTQGLGSFGGVNLLPTLGYGASTDNGFLGGGGDYAHHIPYDSYKEKEKLRKKELKARQDLEKARAAKERLAERLAKQREQEAELAKVAALEQKLTKQEEKITLLLLQLQTLEALMKEWDEEDAIIALLMSSPF